jgi:hypothetical protein
MAYFPGSMGAGITGPRTLPRPTPRLPCLVGGLGSRYSALGAARYWIPRTSFACCSASGEADRISATSRWTVW